MTVVPDVPDVPDVRGNPEGFINSPMIGGSFRADVN